VNSGGHVFGATNFSSPILPFTVTDPTGARLNGLSYSFDFDNARFVLLDQFKRTDNTDNTGGTNNNILDQQSWIDTTLSSKPADTHAFVFSHKNLIGQTTSTTSVRTRLEPDRRSAFIASLQNNGVRHHMSGHPYAPPCDHQGSAGNPDGSHSQVQEIMCSSNSYSSIFPGTAGQREE
jgi:hypothetical protein